MKKKLIRTLTSISCSNLVKSKRSQVTIFILAAVAIVAVIIILFAFRNTISISFSKQTLPNPQQDMESCISENVENALDIILPQGGYISPENYKLYNNIKVAYLCYNKNYYAPCINQEPLYLDRLKLEIKNYISSKVEDCFYNLKKDYEKRGYDSSFGSTNLQIELNPKEINVIINKNINLEKGSDKKSFDRISVKITSPLYDLATIAQEIVNQEAKFCYFEYVGYELTYPAFSIEKMDIDGETKVYGVKEKSSNSQINFAVRSCAMPAGL